jgi:diguanylate cyclase (GGDEF)-like protein
LRLQPELDGLPLVPAGEPLLIERNPRDPLMRHWLAHNGVRDAMLVPIRDGNQVIGVLQVANRLGEASTFSQDDLKLLQTIVAHAEVIWHNDRLMEQLRHDAHHDGVTGLANRNRFQNRLANRLQELPITASPLVKRSRLPFDEAAEQCQAAVLLLDLDRFREVNDALGHGVGDLLLQQVAARLQAYVPPGATVARLGGDEFAVLLPDCSSAKDALRAAEVARTGLTGTFEVQGTFLEVGVSVGVALVPQDGHDPDTVLKHADVAMYSAKRSSQGISRYRRSDDTSSRQRLALAGELRRAMDEGQIDLHYQPKVSMDTGQVTGFEGLARWNHPERGMVMPDQFIPLAEQTGLVGRLTHIALRQALEAAAVWNRQRSTDEQQRGIAVNLSPRRLVEPDLPAVVNELLAGIGVPANLLTLEITESSLMADPQAAQRALHELREIGVRLSVDDFGTGYSALAYLQRLPLDEVKIDKSFVIPMMTDQGARAIVRAIVELAHTLDLTVVAEGVEHETARDALQTMGCDVMQGYFIARPLRVDQIEPWLTDWQRRNSARQPTRSPLPHP